MVPVRNGYSARSITKIAPQAPSHTENEGWHRVTEYTFELRLCGVAECTLCARVGRAMRTPDVTVGKYSLLLYI